MAGKSSSVGVGLRKLPKENLKYYSGRTLGLSITVIVLSVIFFSGTFMSLALSRGFSAMEQRMGADLIVFPNEHQQAAESFLLGKSKEKFYFNDDFILEEVRKVEGVSAATPETYLTSLDAGCCAVDVQIIGFNPKTDFVVQPWIATEYAGELKDDEVIIGADVFADPNGQVRLFNEYWHVAAKLARTGTSYDTVVFVNQNTVEKMFKYSSQVEYIHNPPNGRAISSILVKVDPNYPAEAVGDALANKMQHVGVVSSAGMASQVKANAITIIGYIWLIVAMFWLVGLIVLVAVVATSVGERKKELASLRIMGATRKSLMFMLGKECLFIGLGGGLIGGVLGAIIMYPFANLIRAKLELPYLGISFATASVVVACCVIGALLISILAAIIAAGKTLKNETYLTLREAR